MSKNILFMILAFGNSLFASNVLSNDTENSIPGFPGYSRLSDIPEYEILSDITLTYQEKIEKFGGDEKELCKKYVQLLPLVIDDYANNIKELGELFQRFNSLTNNINQVLNAESDIHSPTEN